MLQQRTQMHRLRSGLILLSLASLLVTCKKDDPTPESPLLNISGFSPESATEGELITIVGEGFNPVKSEQYVFVGDRTLEILSASPTQLVVKLQDFYSHCGPFDLKVKNDTVEVIASQKFTLACPVITSVTPASGDPGDIVSIEGTAFHSSIPWVKVQIGQLVLQVIATSKTLINARIPAGVMSGSFPVTVTVGAGNRTATTT